MPALSPFATSLLLLTLAAGLSTAVHVPEVKLLGEGEGGAICVDPGTTPPGVDLECRVGEIYERLCGSIEACLLQEAVTTLMDLQCALTGQLCDWREATCLDDVFACPLVGRVEQIVNGLDDFTIYPSGLDDLLS